MLSTRPVPARRTPRSPGSWTGRSRRHCLSPGWRSDVLRAALDALTRRLDGRRAAATTITRKRAVLHAVLGHAVETGLLDANPLDRISWHAPASSPAVDPAVVASPAQPGPADRGRRAAPGPSGVLRLPLLRRTAPRRAVALRHRDCQPPGTGWGLLTLTTAAPRTATAWTSDGPPRATRPQAPARRHDQDGPHPARPGLDAPHPLPAARRRAGRAAVPRDPRRPAQRIGVRPHLAPGACYRPRTGPGRDRARPAPLRPAARRLVAVADRRGDPAQIARRAGHSVAVLLAVYTHCIHGHDDTLNQQIDNAPRPAPAAPRTSPCRTGHGSRTPPVSPPTAANLHANRARNPIPTPLLPGSHPPPQVTMTPADAASAPLTDPRKQRSPASGLIPVIDPA